MPRPSAYPESVRTTATRLRRQGKTLRQVEATLHVPRSTLALWLKDVSAAKILAAQGKKRCTHCRAVLLLSDFPWRDKTKGRRQSWCWQCKRDYNNLMYTTGTRKQQVLEANRRAKRRNLKFLRAYKVERGCEKCGYDAHAVALDFHHPRQDKEACVARLASGSLLKLKEEINKCTVLCSNCHRVLHLASSANGRQRDSHSRNGGFNSPRGH